MIQKKQVDAGWIIYNNIIESSGPTKGLWFPALITKLCQQAGVKVEKGEERVRAGLAIPSRTATELPIFSGYRANVQVLEELREIKANQKQIMKFQKYQHEWNQCMEKRWTDNITLTNVPTFVAGASSFQQTKSKAKAPVKRTQPTKQTAEEKCSTSSEEEETATHLGGEETLTGHFTQTNLSGSTESH